MKVKKLVSDKISLININYKKCLIICCILIFIGAVIFACIPKITKFLVNYLCVLKPGHFLRKKHEDKLPFTYKLYLWNVTNPNEIATGIEKPKLQEIGPYVFSQFKQKIDLSDNDTEDSLSYNLWNIYTFNHSLSAPLTGDERVTLLNTVLVGAAVKVKLERPNYINILAESMDMIFKNPSSIFVTMSAMEFIDNGIQIDCNQTVYAAKVACVEMRKSKILKIVNAEKTLLRFRWFDRLNDSIQARYTVKRGANNIYDIGRVIAVNNERMLNVFKEDEKCNLYNGTDKSLFEPFQRKDKIIWAYAHDACKSFPLRFKYRKTIRHIKTAFKSAYFTDPLIHPTCNCNKYTGCAFAGTIDLHSCIDVFVTVSPPHFYLTEPAVLESLDGMNPKVHLHQSGTYFELLSGVPVYAIERVQINLLVKPIDEYHIFSSIADDLWFPVLWYEEKFILTQADSKFIVNLKTLLKIGSILGYILFSIGIIGLVIALTLFTHGRISIKPEIPPVQPRPTSPNMGSEQYQR